MGGPLAGLTVVEHSGGVATRYCGRLFAAWGAQVTRRTAAKNMQIGFAGAAGRAYGEWLDQNKILADALPGPGAKCDLVIAGQDRSAIAVAEAWRAGRADKPTLLALTWFDLDGPYGDWRGSDEIIQALNGLAFGFGEADGPPMLSQGHAAQVVGGLVAYNAALAALLSAPGRRPGRVEVNMLEANLCFTEPGAVALRADGGEASRLGPNRFSPLYPASSYRTADGWVGITCLTPGQWVSLARLIGRPELAGEARFATSLGRLAAADEIDALLIPVMATRTTAEWVRLGDAHRIPTAPMPTPGELADQPHWAQRGAFAPVCPGGAPAPTLPYRMTFDGVGQARWTGDPALGPLAGLKVADFSMGWAGPLCARTLADLGAEVVKVESADHPDWWRGWDASMADGEAMEKRHNFLGVNRNKRGVCLDLTTPAGVDRARALIARCDVVVENYAAGVLEKLGLGPAVQRDLRPGVISLTMPAFGAEGPWSGLRAYGSTVEQASGLPFVNGEAHWPPCLQHVAFGDPVAGLYAASAVLTALAGRERLGGAIIDLAQVACLFQLGADAIVAAGVLGEPLPRTGHARARSPLCAVVATSDGWLAVAADAEAVPALNSLLGEVNRETLAAWAAPQSATAAAYRLQGLGVSAARVQGAHDLTDDPQLTATNHWVERTRAAIGRHLIPATPFRFDGVRPPIRSPAPTLGEHTDAVLAELLRGGDLALPTPHSRNRAFTWKPSHPPYLRLTADQAARYDEEGFFLFENAFTEAEIDAVAAAIAPFEAEGEEALRRAGGRVMIAKADAITFTIHLVAKSETLKAFSRHPVFAGICRDTLGPGARLYWDQAVYKKPGNLEEFPWHQDNGYTFIEPQQYLTCWVALTDATLENGCPWVVPKLHLCGTLAHQVTPLGLRCLTDPPEAVAVPARKGDIVVFSSLTPHRTGPNLTGDTRRAYILQYAPDGVLAFPRGASEGVAQTDPTRQYFVDEAGVSGS